MQLDNFSEHEKMVIKILGDRKMTIQKISEEFYNSLETPLEGQNYVAAIIRRIGKKCHFYELKWTLHGKGAGRGGKTIWRGRR